ncbi:MAG: hypothetical protein IIA14_13690 [SAR324 cluster bacterium]|nr:hypothetical protein [SAR324 cluster bacterium]
MNDMTDADFGQLITSLDVNRKFLEAKRVVFEQTYSEKLGVAMRALVEDIKYIAQMASETLDNLELSISQRMSLKTTLSQLEFEIRLTIELVYE